MLLQVTIWANCQGDAIKTMLNRYHSDKYDVKHFMNYEYIYSNKPIPEDFKHTDIFIYQNYSKSNGTYDLSTILTNVLKPSCKRICIPSLRGEFLFCYTNTPLHRVKNNNTITPKTPYGKFCYGIDYIDNELHDIDYTRYNEFDKTQLIECVYNKLMDPNLVSIFTICTYFNKNIDFLRSKIVSSDIPELLDFIIMNFKQIRLFHNTNHPTGVLLSFMVQKVFQLLSLDYPNVEENIRIIDNSLSDWVMPILPSVSKYYSFTFEDKCSSWYHPDIHDKRGFITKYINDLYFS